MMLSLSFVGVSKSAEGGSISLSRFEPGGPYPLADLDRGIQILWGPNPLGHRNVEVMFKL